MPRRRTTGRRPISQQLAIVAATVIHFLVCCCCQAATPSRKELLTTARSFAREACAEFDEGVPLGSGWLLEDCIQIWRVWVSSLRREDMIRYEDRDVFAEIAVEQRRRGSPCLVESGRYNDGVGSSSIRDFATWVFAEEMGCDWVEGPGGETNETALYCHTTTSHALSKNIKRGQLPNDSSARCSLNNWFGFFTFDAHVSKIKLEGPIENVRVRDLRQRF